MVFEITFKKINRQTKIFTDVSTLRCFKNQGKILFHESGVVCRVSKSEETLSNFI